MRTIIHTTPFPPTPKDIRDERGAWPASWIRLSGEQPRSFVAAYLRRFEMPQAATVRVHVSADQRYELLLDGQRVGRGPERGDPLHWHYETYDLSLPAGPHTLVARVWTLDLVTAHGPAAQTELAHGFLLAAEGEFGELLSTGKADWQTRRVDGYAFRRSGLKHAGGLAGGTFAFHATDYPWGVETGDCDGWTPAETSEEARDRITGWGNMDFHHLRPGTLPAMLDAPRAVGVVRHVEALEDQPGPVLADNHIADEVDAWQSLLDGGVGPTIPAHTTRRVILDLDQYYCLYPFWTVSGGAGAELGVTWAEALCVDAERLVKGNRDEIEGKVFRGRGHDYTLDGGTARRLHTLWWECGRYVQVLVRTADEPLTIDALDLRETRYPLEMTGRIETSEPQFDAAVPIMFRTLQMCAHETYFDCPYYEQLQYTGDTRLQVLTTYVATGDDRLPRKAIDMYAASLLPTGLTQSRYPASARQVIPQFCLYWLGMLHDFAWWRGDREFLHRRMPTARTVMDTFLSLRDDDGLIEWPSGWDWIDWVPGWDRGNPQACGSDPIGINQWQAVYILGEFAALEEWLGHAGRAQELRDAQRELADAATDAFWDESRGLLSTLPDGKGFAEHTQCFALLSGMLDDTKSSRVLAGLIRDDDLDRATIQFRHYLFETFTRAGRSDEIFRRMNLWYDLPGMGFRTALEAPEPSRSDCHAWSAHPIYHAMASILGMRPAAMGFDRLAIRPQLGPLTSAAVDMHTPHGGVSIALQRDGDRLRGKLSLPEDLPATVASGGETLDLQPGLHDLDLPTQ